MIVLAQNSILTNTHTFLGKCVPFQYLRILSLHSIRPGFGCFTLYSIMPATKRTKTYSLHRTRRQANIALDPNQPFTSNASQDSSSEAPATPVVSVVNDTQVVSPAMTNAVPGVSNEILQQITAAVTASVLNTLQGNSCLTPQGNPSSEVVNSLLLRYS